MSQQPAAGSQRRLYLLALPLAGALALVGAALAQTHDAARDVFVDSVEVNVVNLEVTVTDRDGNPVHGLTRDDFEVREDGKPVELSNFYAVETARRVLAADDGSGEPELVALPEDQTLNLAVVIDSENLAPANRNRVIDQIRAEMMRVIRPGDRVMVATLSPYPQVEQVFTDDVAVVQDALDRVARKRAGGQVDLNVLLRQIEREISSAQFIGTADAQAALSGGGESQESSGDIARRVQNMIESYGAQSDFQMRRTLAGLSGMVSSMSGLPGRKSVLYVSEGLTTRPSEFLYETLVTAFPQIAQELGSPQLASRKWDTTDVLMDVARHASANRVTFYTMDARGIASGLAGVETVGIPATIGRGADISTHDTMMQLAAATGGDTMLNPASARRLLDRMAADFSDYYSLGYVSPRNRDGEYHRLEVKVPGRKNVRVRHNEGYRATTVEQEMLDRTVSALVLDVADNPLAVRVELGKEQAEKRNQYVLPVLIKVPISKLVLVPQQREHKGKLAVYVAVRDDEGRMSDPQRFEIPIDIPNESLLSAMTREVGYGVNLLVRGGDSKLAVGVRDEVGAVSSTVNLNVSIGSSS